MMLRRGKIHESSQGYYAQHDIGRVLLLNISRLHDLTLICLGKLIRRRVLLSHISIDTAILSLAQRTSSSSLPTKPELSLFGSGFLRNGTRLYQGSLPQRNSEA